MNSFKELNISQALLIYPEIMGENHFTNILLIDSQVNNYQLFVDSVNSNTYPIVYSISSSKTDLLTLLQTNFTNISRIGIVFTSSLENSKPFLDFNPLFSINEMETAPYSENVQFIINIIKEFQVKNIDYLACNTLNYSNWSNYYQLLTQHTGVIVGASNDKTGNIKFGGDWIMENTSQNIEFIYFTKNIEYYIYLLDNPSWKTGILEPLTIAIDPSNTWMYVTSYTYSTITKILVANPNTSTANWAQGLNGPFGIAIDSTNTWMYVGNLASNSITKISVANPNTYTEFWASDLQGINGPCGIAIDSTDTWMYVVNYGNDSISKISVADPNTYTANWASSTQGINTPYGIAIDSRNIWMYVANNGNSTISKISVANPNTYTANWASSTQGINNPFGIAIDSTNTWMYVANGNGTINQILVANPTVFTSNWATTAYYPTGIALDLSSLYAAINLGNVISQFSLPITCFKEDTKILTDKGYIPIQYLRKGDLIKTLKHDYKAINMIGKKEIHHSALEERIKDQLYKCSQPDYEVFEPLIITGCHCILVDRFINEEQKERVIEVNGNTFVTDGKYRLPACADPGASVYEISGTYIVYHFALENDNIYKNYGVYANGLLVESCSECYLTEFSNMDLI